MINMRSWKAKKEINKTKSDIKQLKFIKPNSIDKSNDLGQLLFQVSVLVNSSSKPMSSIYTNEIVKIFPPEQILLFY